MAKKPSKAGNGNAVTQATPTTPQRDARGWWLPGSSGGGTADAARARRQLNLATIQAMREAFDEGGREAIRKVMISQPAIFLKMLVLLVPRELEVTHTGGVKAMSDEQIEQAITVIEEMLAKRAEQAKTIEGDASPLLPQNPPETDSSTEQTS